jgi:hypothetical protein
VSSRRADVCEEHLVLVVVDDFGELGTKLDKLSGIELATEHRELQVVSVPAHKLEHLSQSFGIGDVIGHDKYLTHWVTLLAAFSAF